MRIVAKPHETTEGHTDKDLFGRKSFGESLANIVQNASDPLVIGLDGNWGEGKSTFVKSWQLMLDSRGVPNLYIDAFESDYLDDAFMVVASAITDYLSKNAPPKKSTEFIEKAKHVGVQVLSLTAKIGIRAASIGAITDSHLQEFGKIAEDVSEEIGSSAEKYIKDRLINHKKERESINHFKEVLSNIPKNLKKPSESPLTIIIDELDRCRPSFAVEMLEKIKHLFSVKNVNFLLVINKTQLKESIKATYGTNIDAHTYLQKFIAIEATLPKKKGTNGDIQKYCEYLINQFEIDKGQDWAEFFTALGTQLNCSLRELERIYSNLAIMLLSEKNSAEINEPVIATVCVLKVMRPGIYMRLSDEDLTATEIYEALRYTPDPKSNNYSMELISKWMQTFLMNEEEFKSLDNLDEIKRLASFYRHRRKVLGLLAQKLSSFSAG